MPGNKKFDDTLLMGNSLGKKPDELIESAAVAIMNRNKELRQQTANNEIERGSLSPNRIGKSAGNNAACGLFAAKSVPIVATFFMLHRLIL